MKKVIASSYDAIHYTSVPWCDVWISFTSKPARMRRRFGPTFIGKRSLLRDIQFEKEFLKEYPQYAEETAKQLREYELALAEVERDGIAIERDNPHNTPNIYINKEFIDKKDVARMIDAFMKHLGYRGAVVKWKKAPKFIVMPS